MPSNTQRRSNYWSLFRNGKVKTLPPGFRFEPTDEELIFHYLRRKVFSAGSPDVEIADVDAREFDPSVLPGDPEKVRFFFVNKEFLDKVDGEISERFWEDLEPEELIKSSEKDIYLIGMKKTLAFREGKPPHGTKTRWLMHEFRLVDTCPRLCKCPHHEEYLKEMEKWVICRVFPERIKLMEYVPSEDEADDYAEMVRQAYPTVTAIGSSSSSSGVTHDSPDEPLSDEGDDASSSGLRKNKRYRL